MSVAILNGDCLQKLNTIPDRSVHCCVTSPPYWGLRDYGHAGQIGLEKTPEAYVARMVEVFREVKRVLRDDGTLWLNLGDSYARSAGNEESKLASLHTMGVGQKKAHEAGAMRKGKNRPPEGLKPKDLIGIPWRVAFALQADGWYLRQDIIWHKPNPMPESVTDRCTKSHEYIFLLSKQPKYYYDSEVIKTPLKDASAARLIQNVLDQKGSSRVPGKTNGTMKAVCKIGGNNLHPMIKTRSGKDWDSRSAGGGFKKHAHNGYIDCNGNPLCGVMANKKSVWTVTTKPYKEAHFATYPPELITPCVLAGCPVGGTVLDPFAGSGTTGAVALEHGRSAILIELNPKYLELIYSRINKVEPVFPELVT